MIQQDIFWVLDLKICSSIYLQIKNALRLPFLIKLLHYSEFNQCLCKISFTHFI
jgi:hypothetical protein